METITQVKLLYGIHTISTLAAKQK